MTSFAMMAGKLPDGPWDSGEGRAAKRARLAGVDVGGPSIVANLRYSSLSRAQDFRERSSRVGCPELPPRSIQRPAQPLFRTPTSGSSTGNLS